MIPAAMFHCGSSIAVISGRCEAIARYVDGMSCMMPRAPTQLFAVGVSPLSAIPCALNSFQSKPMPK